MSAPLIKRLIAPRIATLQYGFREESDCNLAKMMVLYNSKEKGYTKHILIDVKKAFDSIDRNVLRNKIAKEFGKNGSIVLKFIEIYDMIGLCINLYPSKGDHKEAV